jgi:FkbM family methyltransferase
VLGIIVVVRTRNLKWTAINLARRRGWEIRRFDPFSSLGAYLSCIVFPHLGVNCVLDVGAHAGAFALDLRNNGYDGEIISFEPTSSSFAILRDRAAVDAKWSVYNVALGQSEGSATINVMRDTHYSSLRSPLRIGVEDFEVNGNSVDHVETVEVRRLDGLLSEVTAAIDHPRVFLKMDTQGWDLEVFEGAGASLESVVGLQSELSIRALYEGMPDFRTALSTYEARGFHISSMFPVGRDGQLRLAEFDCIMVRSPPGSPSPDA